MSTTRVLIVEDDAQTASMYSRMLQLEGYESAHAPNGTEAIAILKRSRFDVIISDIAMPGMSGIDLLRNIRGFDLDVPVILVTGEPEVGTAAEAVKYGALRYLVKPCDGKTLLEVVAYAARLAAVLRAKREFLAGGDGHGPMANDRAGLEAAFERALETVFLAYQPIVHTGRRNVYAYEALLRAKEPALPNPPAIIEAAERLGRLFDLGRVIRARAAECIDKLPGGALLFLNLHPHDLNDDTLYSTMSPLAKHAPRIVLEITERAQLQTSDLNARRNALRSLGYRFAVDDLGAGYSGLSSLIDIEPDVVKIDMSLVREIDRHLNKQRLVKSVRELCRDMNVALIAEGVETVAERDSLHTLGIELLQGYHFAKPSAELRTPDIATYA